mmetsp:Transcript_27348/g.42964  ORF Transcript_27348/g.42964 Transcript_27348/m.42964 type:complete len:467 (-) Transcript_27348:229-1629(-)
MPKQAPSPICLHHHSGTPTQHTMSSKDRNMFTQNSHGHGNFQLQRLPTGSSCSARAPYHSLRLSDSSGRDDISAAMGIKLKKSRNTAVAVETRSHSSNDEAAEEDPLDLQHALVQALKNDDEETEGKEEEEEGDDVSKKEKQDDDIGEEEKEEQQQTTSNEDGDDTEEEEHETNKNEGSEDDSGASTESDSSNHFDELVELQSLLIALNTLSFPGAYPSTPSLIVQIHSTGRKISNGFANMFTSVCNDLVLNQSRPLALAASMELVAKLQETLDASAGIRVRERVGGRDSVAQGSEVDYDANDVNALDRQVAGPPVTSEENASLVAGPPAPLLPLPIRNEDTGEIPNPSPSLGMNSHARFQFVQDLNSAASNLSNHIGNTIENNSAYLWTGFCTLELDITPAYILHALFGLFYILLRSDVVDSPTFNFLISVWSRGGCLTTSLLLKRIILAICICIHVSKISKART